MISIITIVKNDPRLERLLTEFSLIEKPASCEFIVVDASEGKLDYLKNNFSFVKWISYHPKGKERTYAQQRNIGINHARGDIIVFIDADCIPEKNWLTELLKPIIEKKEVFVSGACQPMKKDYIHKEENYGQYREECETMNMAITKDVVNRVGLFDETLEGCEDSDFCIRAHEQGIKIRYIKSAVIYHDWGGFKQNVLRSYNGGRDRFNFYKKHKKQLFSLSINNIYTLYYITYIVFLPLAYFYPVYLLIILIPSIIKKRNPLKEVYNLTFTVGFLRQLIKTTIHI